MSNEIDRATTEEIDRPVELRFLGDMQRLELGPGDVLVIRLKSYSSREALARMREVLTARFPNNNTIVFEDEVEIGVLTPQKPTVTQGGE